MQKTITISLIATGLLSTGLVAAGTAQAQNVAPAAQRGPVQEMTPNAVEARVEQMFERMDVNKDGALDAADREAAVAARSTAAFDRVDADSNGVIDREEFAAISENRAERRSAHAETRGQRAGRGGPEMRGNRGAGQFAMRGRGGPGRQGLNRQGPGNPRALIGRADADNNGSVTKQELTTAALARFDAADADGNGTVTSEERRSARTAARQERRQAFREWRQSQAGATQAE